MKMSEVRVWGSRDYRVKKENENENPLKTFSTLFYPFGKPQKKKLSEFTVTWFLYWYWMILFLKFVFLC